jgi:hypothetical protein
MTFHIGMSSSQLTNSIIFQRGRAKNHQPVFLCFHLTGTSRCGTTSSLGHHQEQCPTGDSGYSGNPAWLETLRATGHLDHLDLWWILWRFKWWFVVAFYGDILGIKREIAKNSGLTWSNCPTENVGNPHKNSTVWNLMVPIWNAINWRVYHVFRTADLRGSSNSGEFQIFWAESCWISEFPTVENLVFLIKSLCSPFLTIFRHSHWP